MDYPARLQWAMSRKHPPVSRAQLAAAIGISVQALGMVLRGQTKSLTASNNAVAAQFLGVSPLWLATGKGESHSPAQEAELQPAGKLRNNKQIPVVGEVKGGSDGFLEELQYPTGHGEGFVEYPAVDTAAYALRVRGDSMHPRYRAGEYIVVSPSFEPQPGDDVVASLRDGRKLLKQLNWIRDGEVQLLSINDGFAPMTIPLAEVLTMHLVDGRVRRAAFTKQ